MKLYKCSIFHHLTYSHTTYTIFLSYFKHFGYHIMDPNIDLDEVLDQMIDEELEDNTNEEIIRLILESQQQLHGNTTGCSQRRIVVHHNHEEGHD